MRVPPESLERIQSLLESIGTFGPSSTVWQVASRCAVAVRTTLDARGVVIHLHDSRKQEIRIVGVDGPNYADLLGSVASTDDDFVAATVLANGRTMSVRFDGELPLFVPERLRTLGASRSLVAVPIMSVTGCVAFVELVDVDPACEPLITTACGVVREELLRHLSP